MWLPGGLTWNWLVLLTCLLKNVLIIVYKTRPFYCLNSRTRIKTAHLIQSTVHQAWVQMRVSAFKCKCVFEMIQMQMQVFEIMQMQVSEMIQMQMFEMIQIQMQVFYMPEKCNTVNANLHQLY